MKNRKEQEEMHQRYNDLISGACCNDYMVLLLYGKAIAAMKELFDGDAFSYWSTVYTDETLMELEKRLKGGDNG